MSLLFQKIDVPVAEFSIEDMDQETTTITVGVDWGYKGCSYHLTRDEARQVWEHLGRELGFTES